MNKKGNLFISIMIIVVAGILSATKFMDGRTTDAALWLIVAIVTLIKEFRRYTYNHKR